jgi:hypothetical protein
MSSTQAGSAGDVRWNSRECQFEIYTGAIGQTGLAWYAIDWRNEDYFTRRGWTISYYPELNIWGSFHDYIPYIYFNTTKDFYSLTDQYDRPVWATGDPLNTWEGTTYGNAGIWKHNAHNFHGIHYQENNENLYSNGSWLTRILYKPFEFEFIHNELKVDTLLHSSFDYALEVFNQEDISILDHGFTNFLIYNTFQIDFSILEYLINIRRIGNEWKVNKFRDMARLEDQAGNLNLPNTDPYYMSSNINVVGGTNTGTFTTSHLQNMFTINGMNEIVNNNFIDLTKNWTLQKKFIDKWVGIRLICDNVSNNLLNLYTTNVAVRKMHR